MSILEKNWLWEAVLQVIVIQQRPEIQILTSSEWGNFGSQQCSYHQCALSAFSELKLAPDHRLEDKTNIT